MNIKKIIISLMLVSSMTIGLTGCSTNKEVNDDSKNYTAINKDDNNTKDTNSDTNKVTTDTNDEVTNNTTASQEEALSSNDTIKDDVYLENNIAEKTKNYIINGQENKPESEKIKWSATFLNQLDIESLYKQYIDNGGISDDLESFAKYLSLNAPISSNWESLFEKDFFDAYGEKVVKLEHLNDDLYQAYVLKNDSEVPYVVVSSRTGYFHG